VLDADITGPSVPKSFGITSRAMQDEECLLPTVTSDGIKIMSINLLLEDVNSPVVWRGPVISGVIEQFWTDVRWGELDYLFVDMPPGTGDVALTVFQSLPVDGIVIVSTPQDLVKMIVNKAYNMAKMMNVPVLGLVENMSYYTCPHCNEKISIFGESKIDETALELNLPVLAKLPINPNINKLVDEGKISEVECSELDEFVAVLKD
jgi:Mrp family chromosome partitioning ATPase